MDVLYEIRRVTESDYAAFKEILEECFVKDYKRNICCGGFSKKRLRTYSCICRKQIKKLIGAEYLLDRR